MDDRRVVAERVALAQSCNSHLAYVELPVLRVDGPRVIRSVDRVDERAVVDRVHVNFVVVDIGDIQEPFAYSEVERSGRVGWTEGNRFRKTIDFRHLSGP